MTSLETRNVFIETIKNKLGDYQQKNDQQGDWATIKTQNNMAAVAVILVEDNNAWSLVFIERAHNPEDIHSGQIAFPGGRVEQADNNLIATAIRECQEETGIAIANDQVVSLLPMHTSRTGFQVRPVVAVADWPQSLNLQASEVASLFTMPLNWFRDKQNWDSATTLGFPENATVVYKPYNQHRVWGMTAKIVQQLITII